MIGVVHRFSSHALMLRYWLGYAGVDPDRDVDAAGAAAFAHGRGAARWARSTGSSPASRGTASRWPRGWARSSPPECDIWQRGVEKVLAMRTDWMEANAETVDRLLVAVSQRRGVVRRSGQSRGTGATCSNGPNYVGQPAEWIMPALERPTCAALRRRAGRHSRLPALSPRGCGLPVAEPGAVDLFAARALGDGRRRSAATERQAADVFRPDIYRRALGGAGLPMPGASMKVEGALTAPLPVGVASGCADAWARSILRRRRVRSRRYRRHILLHLRGNRSVSFLHLRNVSESMKL